MGIIDSPLSCGTQLNIGDNKLEGNWCCLTEQESKITEKKGLSQSKLKTKSIQIISFEFGRDTKKLSQYYGECDNGPTAELMVVSPVQSFCPLSSWFDVPVWYLKDNNCLALFVRNMPSTCSHHLCISHCCMNNWPCGKDSQKRHVYIHLKGWFWGYDRDQKEQH